jgi:hypothetical protein
VCEQYIDSKLEDGEIEKIKRLVDILNLSVSSKEDASLGVFIGSIYSQFDINYLKMYNKLPEKDDIEDYHRILRRRSHEIRVKFSSQKTPKEIDNAELTLISPKKPDRSLEDYPLVLQKRTEELMAERDEQTALNETSNLDTAGGMKSNPRKEVKFSYNSNTRNGPVRKIFGIPTKKETVSPTV